MWTHQPRSFVGVTTADVTGSRKSKVEVEPPGVAGTETLDRNEPKG